jgi:pimeloyl-ACP methyl ester carboxylesterase
MPSASQEIELVCAGRRLGCTLHLPAGAPTSGVLFLHGYGSSRDGYESRARAVAEGLGAAAFTFDFGGHGASEGDRSTLSPRDHLSEARVAFDALADSLPDGAKRLIGVCGASYGGYVGTLLVGERPIHRLLLRAPALYDDDAFAAPPGDRSTTVEGKHARVTEAARSLSGGVLLLESENDDVIPHEVIDFYLHAFPDARREILQGAGHALSEDRHRQAFLQLILSWFATA